MYTIYNWLGIPVNSSVSKLLDPPISELRDLALVTPQLWEISAGQLIIIHVLTLLLCIRGKI